MEPSRRSRHTGQAADTPSSICQWAWPTALDAKPRRKPEPPSSSLLQSLLLRAGRDPPRRLPPRCCSSGVQPARIRLAGCNTVKGTPVVVIDQDNIRAPCKAR
ncbi:hypothetical protein NDU88_001475 [Pleurodeles waltl]|uniref:Uncharacterized protein n=1 Tax=Pleurodeles waltl TaxID=8319 RepID=A0AAV7TK74_PLEWA|nr:hypothetical protein NDU88_001475 [Pleurodeles waltl]